MLFSWTSATNCARIYNEISQQLQPGSPISWPFNLSVTSGQVYDAFTLLSLLEDCQLQKSTLIVPHKGTLGASGMSRFAEAVHIRNEHLQHCSQPELFHYCNKCTRFYPGKHFPQISLCHQLERLWFQLAELQHKVSVVVIDGVCIGHPCCGIPNCKVPIKTNRDRFCPAHASQNGICAINSCTNSVVSGSKVCHLVEHQETEKMHNDQGQSRFQLRERLKRARIACPNNSALLSADLDDGLDDSPADDPVNDNGEVEFDLTQDGHPIPTPVNVQTTSRKLRAQFGRKCTHNEQLFVAPCGIIIARETFYHSEAPSNVIVCVSMCSTKVILIIYKEMIKWIYHLPGTMPKHIFYDNNCTIAKMVKNDPAFKDIGLTVDVFHFKCKHSENDVFCQENCNPAAYPELLRNGGQQWFFNLSVAEQTNAWIGGYNAICCEMGVERYNFFLDEMIRRRNIFTLTKLKQSGEEPGTRPL